MTMNEMQQFSGGQILPAWFLNSLQKFVGVASENFRLIKQSDTLVRSVAGTGDKGSIVGINGKYRWNESNVDRAHPGGAAGTYKIFVTAKNNAISGVTDSTDYAFDLAITSGGNPTIVLGVVDIFREVGYCVWDGSKITEVVQTVDGVDGHAISHLPGGSDPLPQGLIDLFCPVGAQMPYSGEGDLLPGVWMLADGRLISSAQYPVMDANCGGTVANPARRHKYNGGVNPGGGLFRIPDKRGRGSIGADNMGTGTGDAGRIAVAADTPGASGGTERHTLSALESGVNPNGKTGSNGGGGYVTGYTGQMGYFSQSFGSEVDSPPGHPFVIWGSGTVNLSAHMDHSHQIPNHQHNGFESRAADQSHNNMQPYQVDMWIVRVA